MADTERIKKRLNRQSNKQHHLHISRQRYIQQCPPAPPLSICNNSVYLSVSPTPTFPQFRGTNATEFQPFIHELLPRWTSGCWPRVRPRSRSPRRSLARSGHLTLQTPLVFVACHFPLVFACFGDLGSFRADVWHQETPSF